MSGLNGVVSNIARHLSEGLEPGRVVTWGDYNHWLWGLGPAKVQELLKEVHEIVVDGFTLQMAYGGLLSAWRRHCARMGWDDQAFTESGKQARQDLLDKFTRPDSIDD